MIPGLTTNTKTNMLKYTLNAGIEEVPTPTASNTFDTYWEMSGEPEPVEIYIDEVEMKVDANIKYFVENEDFAALAGKSYEDAFTAGEYKESKASSFAYSPCQAHDATKFSIRFNQQRKYYRFCNSLIQS